jgi:hypothetical protein
MALAFAAFLSAGALQTFSACFFTVLATPEPVHGGQMKTTLQRAQSKNRN